MRRPQHGLPFIFAHRGASKVAPENTLPAFAAAIDLGADGVELDVQYTQDGKLVVFHNPTLESCTNGSGRVTSHSFEEIRKLDAGSWFGPQFAGTKIPTLDEVLEFLHGKLLVNIELKTVDLATSTIGADVVAAVRQHQMADDVVISSFNPVALRRARQAGREIECALLLAHDLPGWMRSTVARHYSLAQSLHPDVPMVDRKYVTWAHKRGFAVRPWTVDDEDDMQRMISLGVDAIITDLPEVLRSLM